MDVMVGRRASEWQYTEESRGFIGIFCSCLNNFSIEKSNPLEKMNDLSVWGY